MNLTFGAVSRMTVKTHPAFELLRTEKISSLKELLNTAMKEITFDIKSLNQLDLISQFLDQKGETLVKIKLSDQNNDLN